MYKLLRSLLFFFDAEAVHHFSMKSLSLLGAAGMRPVLRSSFRADSGTATSFGGLQFTNPVGLGAGFDKNALYLSDLEAIGFGFVEIGTVTPIAQEGNPGPRLFRLPADKALINRMGFNNHGVETVAARLKAWREANPKSALVIGGNIGKNKVTPNEDAWKDYERCFAGLHPWVDYFVVNVSSPNTPGLRALQEKESLRQIFATLAANDQQKARRRPVFLKIAPDLSQEQVDDVISLALEINLDGLVVSNTTLSRDGLSSPATLTAEAGGLSGRPLREKSTALIRYIVQQSGGRIPVIGSGGIFTAADAKEKLDAGAGLVQVWTGFIYEGPGIVKRICRSLK